MSTPAAVSAARPGDRERAAAILSFLAQDTADTWGTVLAGEPHSKARPRFGKDGRTYQDPADAAAEEATKWKLRAWSQRPWLTGNVALGCVFFRSSRQEIDDDNMLKHICDAANGLLWVDDSQVTREFADVELDVDHPRTILVLAPHVSTMQRGTDYVRLCPSCAGTFTPSRHTQQFCSRPCSVSARRTAVQS